MKSMWSSHIPYLESLPLIFGAEPDEQEDGNEDQKPGGAGATGGAGTPDSESGAQNEGDPQKKIQAQDEIIARKQTALEEAERELQELREFRQKAETEKLSADEKKDLELQTAVKERDALKEGMQKLVLQNAFLNSNEFEWHKPERALALVDLSAVEIVQDKDGQFRVKNPDALKSAIKDLAESDPYLVKQKDDSEDKVWKGKTGDAPPKKRQTDESAERQRLLNKYSALRK